MKLGAFLIATTMAGRADKRGKSGRRDMSNERYIWQSPRCMVNEALCDQTCNLEINQSFGNITFGSDEYQSGRSCLWKIDIPADREISLKFVDDFDLEWHNWCAFDKVHIYDGIDNNRLGRFCGPKQDGKHQMKPFDGARRNKPDVDGKLAFWDKFYNTQSNTVLIGFDADQDNSNFRGFTLKWTSQKIAALNFRDVEYALNYIRKNLIKRIMNEEFVDNGASVMSRSVNSLIRNANKAIYDQNRPRKCTRPKTEEVNDTLYNELVKFHDGNGKARNFKNYAAFAARLTLDYIRPCKNSNSWWGRINALNRKWDKQIKLAREQL